MSFPATGDEPDQELLNPKRDKFIWGGGCQDITAVYLATLENGSQQMTLN